MANAPEFTPELSSSYLYDSLAGIDQRGREDEGRASAEAASRGLLNQDYEASAIGGVRAGVARDRSKAIGDFNFNVAGLNREERLGDKSRSFAVEDRDFAATEAEKQRAFTEKMARMGYLYNGEQADKNRSGTEQGAMMGGVFSLGSSALGGYLGGLGSKKAGV